MSVTVFINKINEQIKPLFDKFTGSRIYGLAQGIISSKSDKPVLVPAIVDKNGEGTFAGIDDVSPFILYHKANLINASIQPNSGVGDSIGNLVYNYSNSMIIFLDRKKTKLLPDELVLFIQANLPETLKVDNYKSVNLRIQNIILNTQTVFASEYQNTMYSIKPEQNLFAINYTIESIFDKKCFAKCP